MDVVERDRFIVGVTVFCEASNQGRAGIRATGHSIVNRHRAGKWFSGATLAACCLQPYAYTSWNSNDPNRVRGLSINPQDPVMVMCLEETRAAMDGETEDTTLGATHYYRAGTVEPDWVSGVDKKTGVRVAPPAEFTVQINDHRFYKGVR